MENDNIKEIYEALSPKYKNLGTIDEFSKRMEDDSNRGVVYQALTDKGLNKFNDYNSFNTSLGYKPKERFDFNNYHYPGTKKQMDVLWEAIDGPVDYKWAKGSMEAEAEADSDLVHVNGDKIKHALENNTSQYEKTDEGFSQTPRMKAINAARNTLIADFANRDNPEVVKILETDKSYEEKKDLIDDLVSKAYPNELSYLSRKEKEASSQFFGKPLVSFEDIDRKIEELKKQLEIAYREDSEEQKKLHDSGGLFKRMTKGMYDAEQHYKTGGIDPQDASFRNPVIMALQESISDLEKSKDMISATNKGDGALTSLGEGFVHGGANILKDFSGTRSAIKSGQLLRIKYKIDNKEPLTSYEQELLNATAISILVEQGYGDDVPLIYELSKNFMENIPFLANIVFNPAFEFIKVSEKAAKNFLKKSGVKYIEEYLEKDGANKVVKFVAGKGLKLGRDVAEKIGENKVVKFVADKGAKLGRDVAGAYITNTTSDAGRMLGEMAHRMYGEVVPGMDEKGNIVGKGFEGGKDFGRAAFESNAAKTISYFSERLGAYIPGVNKFLNEKALDALSKVGFDDIRKWVSMANGSDLGRLINDIKKKSHFDGTFVEHLEEVSDDGLNAILVGDTTFDTAEGTGVFNLKRNLHTLANVAFMSGVFGGAQTVGAAQYKYSIKRKLRKSDKAGAKVFGERWDEIRNEMDSSENPLSVISEKVGKGMDKQQHDAMARYAYFLSEYQGLNNAALKRGDIPEEIQEIDDAYEEGTLIVDKSMLHQEKYNFSQLYQEFEALKDKDGQLYDLIKEGLSDPVFALNKLKEQSFSVEDIDLAKALWKENNRMDGALDRNGDEIDEIIKDSNDQMKDRSNNGMIYRVVLDDKTEGYVVGGNIVLNDDGSINQENSSPTVFVKDMEGNNKQIRLNEILSMDTPVSIEEQISTNESSLRSGLMQGLKESLDYHPDVQDAKIGETFKREGVGYMVTGISQEGVNIQPVGKDGKPDMEGSEVISHDDYKTIMTEVLDARDIVSRSTQEDVGQSEGVQEELPMDENGDIIYHQIPIEKTLEDLNDGSLNRKEVESIVSYYKDAAIKDVKALEKSAPKESSPSYLMQKGEWDAKLAEANRIVKYWEDVEDAISMGNLHDGSLIPKERESFVSSKKEAAIKSLNKIEKNPPKPTLAALYRTQKKEWETKVEEARAKVKYWENIENEIANEKSKAGEDETEAVIREFDQKVRHAHIINVKSEDQLDALMNDFVGEEDINELKKIFKDPKAFALYDNSMGSIFIFPDKINDLGKFKLTLWHENTHFAIDRAKIENKEEKLTACLEFVKEYEPEVYRKIAKNYSLEEQPEESVTFLVQELVDRYGEDFVLKNKIEGSPLMSQLFNEIINFIKDGRKEGYNRSVSLEKERTSRRGHSYTTTDNEVEEKKSLEEQRDRGSGETSGMAGSDGLGKDAAAIRREESKRVVDEPQQTKDDIPRDKNGIIYHLIPVEKTLENLYDGSLEQDEIDAIVSSNIKASLKDLNKIEKNPPKPGVSKDSYLTKKEEWRRLLEESTNKAKYWENIDAEIKKRNKVEPINETPQTAEELAAQVLSSIKITPESYRSETGFGKSEQKGMIGSLASKEKGGISIEEAGERVMLADSENGTNLLDQNDANAGRNAVLSVLMDARTRGDIYNYVKRKRIEQREREKEAENSAKEDYFMRNLHLTPEEYEDFVDQLAPSLVDHYEHFDEIEINAILDQEIKKEYYYGRQHKEGAAGKIEKASDSTREEQGISGGYELLQREGIISSGRDGENQNKGGLSSSGLRSVSQEASLSESTSGIIQDLHQAEQETASLIENKIPKNSSFGKFLSESEYVKSQLERFYNENSSDFTSKEDFEQSDKYDDVYNDAIDYYSSYIQELSDNGSLQYMYDNASIGDEIKIKKGVESSGFDLEDVIDTKPKKAKRKEEREQKKIEKGRLLDLTGLSSMGESDKTETNSHPTNQEAILSAIKDKRLISILQIDKEKSNQSNYTNDNENEIRLRSEENASEKDVPGIEKRVSELSNELNTPVTIIRNESDLPQSVIDKKGDKKVGGWYDINKNEVFVYLPDTTSVADVENTVVHEIVGHKGMRELLGKEGYNDLLKYMYDNADADLRKIIDERIKTEGDLMAALDEVFAYQAGRDAGTANRISFWEKVKGYVKELLRKMGIDIPMTTDHVRYYIWKSRNALRKGSIVAHAEDVTMRHKSGILGVPPIEDETEASIREFKAKVRHAHIVNVKSETDLDNLKKFNVGEKNIENLKKAFQNPDVLATYNNSMGTILVFPDKIKDLDDFKLTLWHENVHYAIARSGIENKEELLNACLEYVKEFEPKVYRNIKNDYSDKEMPEESVAFLVEEFVKRHGEEKVLTSSFEGYPQISDLLNEIINFIKDGKKEERNNTWRQSDTSRSKRKNKETSSSLSVGKGESLGESGGRRDSESSGMAGRGGLLGQTDGLLRQPGRNNELEGSSGVLQKQVGQREEGERLIRLRKKEDEQNERTGKEMYENSVRKTVFHRITEAFQDSMVPLDHLIKAICHESGRPLEEKEDAYTAENHLSSINTAEVEKFHNRHVIRITASMYKLINACGMEDQKDLRPYMFAKSGLERNRTFYVRDAFRRAETDGVDISKLKADYEFLHKGQKDALEKGAVSFREYNDTLDNYVKTKISDKYTAQEDYSGLTELFKTDEDVNIREEALSLVEDIESKAPKESENFWNAITYATGYVLRKSKDSGLTSVDTYNHVKDMMYWYIPMRGWDEKTAGDMYDYFGSDATTKFAPVLKKAKGHKHVADDPIATIGSIAESTILAGNRNLVKQRLLNLAMNRKTPLITITDSWVEMKGTKNDPQWTAVYPSFGENDSAEVISQKMKDFESLMKEKENEGTAKHLNTVKESGIPYIATPAQVSEHLIRVKRDGYEFTMVINGNPRAAQAINGLTNPETNEGTIGRWSGIVNRHMAAFFTTKNPTFVARNLSRDLLFANAAIYAKENNEYWRTFTKNSGHVMKDIWLLVSKYKRDELDMNNEIHRFFKEFIENGGETGFVNMLGLDAWKKRVRKDLRVSGEGVVSVRRGFRFLGESVEYMNRCAEDVSRFSTYMTSRQMGRSIFRSVSDAKEVTVNFNRKGSAGKAGGVIGGLASVTRGFYLFMNAGIQSMVNLSRIIYKNPNKSIFGVITPAFVAGYLMPYLNEFLFGGDDDKENYDNQSRWLRRNNLMIGGDGFYITIPLPIELRAFYGLGESFSQFGRGKIDAKELFYSFISQGGEMLPLSPFTSGDTVFESLAPDFIKPFLQIYGNKDFKGDPIYKDSFNENLPLYKKAYAGTPRFLVNSSKLWNELWGGNDYKKSGMDFINPAMVEHLVTGYTGGVGQLVSDVSNIITSGLDGKLAGFYNWPVLKAFVHTSNEKNIYSQTNNTYNDLRKEMESTLQLERNYAKDGRYDKELEELESSKEMVRANIIKEYDDVISNLSKQMKEAPEEEVEDMKMITNELRRNAVLNIESIYNGKRDYVKKIDDNTWDKTTDFLETKSQKAKAEYLRYVTIDDILEDGKLSREVMRLKPFYDNVRKLYEKDTDEGNKYYDTHRDQIERYIEGRDYINEMNRRKEMLGKENPKEVMKDIRVLRKDVFEVIR